MLDFFFNFDFLRMPKGKGSICKKISASHFRYKLYKVSLGNVLVALKLIYNKDANVMEITVNL